MKVGLLRARERGRAKEIQSDKTIKLWRNR